MKTDNEIRKNKAPYMYDNYNLTAWFCSQIKSPVPVIAKLQNSLVAAMNEYHHMPKLIIIIPDKDVIESIVQFDIKIDCGIKDTIFDNLHWLMQQIGKCLITCREDLKSKNPGAITPEYTHIVWIEMLTRPITEDLELARIWKVRRKFNSVLRDLLKIEEFMDSINIQNMQEDKYYDTFGELTSAGQTAFWCNLDKQLKEYEFNLAQAQRTTLMTTNPVTAEGKIVKDLVNATHTNVNCLRLHRDQDSLPSEVDTRLIIEIMMSADQDRKISMTMTITNIDVL